MSAGKVRQGGVFVEIGAEAGKFFATLANVNKQIGQAGKAMAMMGAKLTAVGTAITAPLAGAAAAFAAVGDSIQKVAARTGLSAEAISGLAFAAEQSGADMATLEKGIRTMQRTLADAAAGGGAAAEAFRRLGMDVGTLASQSPEQQFMAMATALAAIENPGERAAAAMRIFGRAGAGLLPMLAGGAAGIDELRAEAARLGLVMDQDTADSAAALTDAMNAMTKAVRAIVVNVGGALAPIFTKLANIVAGLAGQFSKFVKENARFIQVALAVGAAVTGLGVALAAAGVAVMGLSAGLGAIGGVLAAIASPIGLVVGGLAAMVAFGPQIRNALGGAFGSVGAMIGDAANSIAGPLRTAVVAATNTLNDMGDTAAQAFRGITDAVAAGDIQKAFDILWTGVEVIWLKGLQAVDNAFHPWIDGILGAFDFLVFEAAKLWEDLFVTLATNTWGQYLLGAVDNIVNGVMASFDFLVGSIQKSWAIITGFFDSAANVQSEIDRIDAANRARADERDRTRPGMAGRVGISEDEKNRIRQQAQANRDSLDQAREDRVAARGGRRDQRQQRITDAEAKLAELTAEAADAAAEVRQTTVREVEKLDLDSLKDLVGDRQADVAGTFSAAAVGGMGFGQSLAQKQLDELKGIHSGIDRLSPAVIAD
jgi:NTP pyrophosphatase (non-canonical NTP hydrolase)